MKSRRRLLIGCGVVLSVTVLVLLVAIAVLPTLARRLEWGRYGLGPPVNLKNIDEVTQITSIRFSNRAVLLNAEFLGGPTSQVVFAKISIPERDVSEFLEQNRFEEASEEERYVHDDTLWYPSHERKGQRSRDNGREWWQPDSARRFVSADTFRYVPGACWILIDLDNPSVAILYLYWQSD